ncbi:MAG TPA: DMT family transporter [Salinisphaeraceae bacterium]|nr:DMT family transporter [Salinisphaeraceae bacterium]
MLRKPALSPSSAGILYICAGAFCLTVNDALAKYLDDYLPVMEIIFFRMLFSLPLIIVFGLLAGGRQALVSHAPWLQAIRGVIAIMAPITYITGLAILPLAANAGISFASPLFITFFAVVLFGERPGWRQWAATGVGFAGVLCVIQPGTAVFSWGAFLPLGAALAYAILMLSARTLAERGDSVWITMIYATAIPLLISALPLPWIWQQPGPAQWLALVGAGVFGGAAITLITQAFRVGSASIVAPFDYTGLLWAALLGWLFWGEIPTAAALFGMFIIIVSGVYLALRQGAPRRRRLQR